MKLEIRTGPALIGSMVFFVTFIASVVLTFVLPYLIDGMAIQTSSTLLALPFVALGLWAYAQGKRWLHLAGTAGVSLVLALFEWRAGLLVAMVLAGFAGTLASTRMVHERLLIPTLLDIESYGTSSKRSPRMRAIGFLLSIPEDFDTRGIVFNRGLIRRDLRVPVRCYITIVSPLMLILLIYLVIGPGQSANIYDCILSAFAVTMYMVALSLPWMVFSALDVRISFRGAVYRPGDGLMATASRFSFALLMALVVVIIAVGLDLPTLCIVCASIVFCMSMMVPYALGLDMTDNDAYLETKYSEWVTTHPVTVGSGLDGSVSEERGDGVPGTPRRPMDSCFPQMKN